MQLLRLIGSRFKAITHLERKNRSFVTSRYVNLSNNFAYFFGESTDHLSGKHTTLSVVSALRLLRSRASGAASSLAALFLLLFLPQSTAAQSARSRAADSLLHRPSLQRVVHLQIRRQGDSLRALLTAPAPAVRARAAFALASVQDSTAVPALLRLLRDPSPAVRADAAFALGQAPGAVPAESLLTALRREQRLAPQRLTPQRRLLEALGKQGDATSLAELVTHNFSDSLTADVALAIGRYGLREITTLAATARIIELLGASDARTRLNAAYFFARTEPPLWADRASASRAALDDLAPGDPAAMHLLRGLGRRRAAADLPHFSQWLRRSPDWRIRTEAARALAATPDTAQALPPLRSALADSSDHVAITAATGLASLAPWPSAGADFVRQWIEAHPDRWRIAAPLMGGLAQHGERSFVMHRLRQWENALPPPAYAAGLGALAHFADADTRRVLERAVQHADPRVAGAAVQALAARWKREQSSETAATYFAAFTRALRRDDLATRYYAAPELADSLFRPLGAADSLARVYATLAAPVDIEPMTAILTALGQTGGATAASVLREATKHPHPVLRRTAADALAQLTGEPAPTLPDIIPPAERTIDWAYLAEKGPRPRLVLQTGKGRVTLALDAEAAPLTTQTILQLAEQGAYDDVPFHRVVPNFVVQGGDVERGDGFGGPGFSIRSEFTRIPYRRGAVGMASAGKDTEGSQFFITHSMQPHLDGRYTTFGTVERGMNVVDRLQPYDRILRARVLSRP